MSLIHNQSQQTVCDVNQWPSEKGRGHSHTNMKSHHKCQLKWVKWVWGDVTCTPGNFTCWMISDGWLDWRWLNRWMWCNNHVTSHFVAALISVPGETSQTGPDLSDFVRFWGLFSEGDFHAWFTSACSDFSFVLNRTCWETRHRPTETGCPCSSLSPSWRPSPRNWMNRSVWLIRRLRYSRSHRVQGATSARWHGKRNVNFIDNPNVSDHFLLHTEFL